MVKNSFALRPQPAFQDQRTVAKGKFPKPEPDSEEIHFEELHFEEADFPAEFVPPPPVSDQTFVRVQDYIPAVAVELKYATEDNFLGQTVYDFTEAYLRYGTVKKLAAVQTELEKLGYGLKIWDAFRPVSAQFKLWQAKPDPRYVANPNTGHSAHSRGNTVDLTLISIDSEDLVMPTAFDDFSGFADRDYRDVSEEAAANALLLETLMIGQGFKAYPAEWWHYSDNVSYEVEEEIYELP